MNSPILVEVLRGGLVESRHGATVAVVDADGRGLLALALVESGAADRYRLTDQELALACASHSGEPGHVATAQSILARAGLDITALRCGAHPPIHQPSAAALARAGAAPSALHNNCSGKHAGFLCLACALGAEPQDYVEAGHRVQREVRSAIEN